MYHENFWLKRLFICLAWWYTKDLITSNFLLGRILFVFFTCVSFAFVERVNDHILGNLCFWRCWDLLLFLVCHHEWRKVRVAQGICDWTLTVIPTIPTQCLILCSVPEHSCDFNLEITFHMQPPLIFWCRQIFKKQWEILDSFELRSITNKWRQLFLMNNWVKASGVCFVNVSHNLLFFRVWLLQTLFRGC